MQTFRRIRAREKIESGFIEIRDIGKVLLGY